MLIRVQLSSFLCMIICVMRRSRCKLILSSTCIRWLILILLLLRAIIALTQRNTFLCLVWIELNLLWTWGIDINDLFKLRLLLLRLNMILRSGSRFIHLNRIVRRIDGNWLNNFFLSFLFYFFWLRVYDEFNLFSLEFFNFIQLGFILLLNHLRRRPS